jgi:hypothetical protein
MKPSGETEVLRSVSIRAALEKMARMEEEIAELRKRTEQVENVVQHVLIAASSLVNVGARFVIEELLSPIDVGDPLQRRELTPRYAFVYKRAMVAIAAELLIEHSFYCDGGDCDCHYCRRARLLIEQLSPLDKDRHLFTKAVLGRQRNPVG